MTPPARGRRNALPTAALRRGLVAIGLLAALAPGAVAAAYASSQTPTPSTPPVTITSADTTVRVDLLRLGPLGPTAGDTLTLSGTVTNASDLTLTNLNAYLRISRAATTDRDELSRLVAPEFRGGFRPGPFVPLAAMLAPGGTAAFDLEVPVADLGFADAGVYPVGVEVLASFEDGTRTAAGRSMTVLPWVPIDLAADAAPEVEVAVVVPLTAPVDRRVDGTYLTDDLGAQLAPNGALGVLLGDRTDASAGGAGSAATTVTWLVDPAVLEAAADMADGYEVRAGTDTAGTPGAHAADAAAWLDRLARRVPSGAVSLLPYADVDAVALVRAGMGADVAIALDAAPDVAVDAFAGYSAAPPGGWRTPRLLYPPAGALDAATLGVVSDAGVQGLLLNDTNLLPASAAGATTVSVRSGQSAVTVAGFDSGLTAALAASAGPIAARQLVAAHTALAALAASSGSLPSALSPSSASGPLVVVAPTPLAADAEPALAVLAGAVPWVDPVRVADIVATTPTTGAELSYPDTADEAELPQSHLRRLAALHEQSGVLAALSGDADVATELDRGRLRAASAALRPYPDVASELATDQAATLTTALSRVRIVTTGAVTLSSDRGRFPVTVANDTDRPVTVLLSLRSQVPARLQTSEPELVQIAAGAKTTVDVSAQATSNGVYLVDARLQTADGAAFGESIPITVRATQYDTVAWVVMGVAGGIILLGSGRRLIQRARAARQVSA